MRDLGNGLRLSFPASSADARLFAGLGACRLLCGDPLDNVMSKRGTFRLATARASLGSRASSLLPIVAQGLTLRLPALRTNLGFSAGRLLPLMIAGEHGSYDEKNDNRRNGADYNLCLLIRSLGNSVLKRLRPAFRGIYVRQIT